MIFKQNPRISPGVLAALVEVLFRPMQKFVSNLQMDQFKANFL
jgi:hypothetical protein